MNVTRILYFLILFFSAQVVAAQEKATLAASLEKNRILIGEPVRLVIEADIPNNAPIKFFTIDSIDHFEFEGTPKIDTVNTKTGTIIKGVYTITSFDSGHWVIPSFILSDELKTDSIPVDVVFSEFDPDQDYHDVKGIIEVKSKEKKEWWYYAVAGLAGLLLLIYLFTRKKKRKFVVKEEAPVDPYKEAMQQLEQLQRENPDARQFYSRLTDIFRLYIFKRKGILSLQKTTDDLVLQLKALNLGKEQFDTISQSLQLSDFVKFAKYVPPIEDNRKVFESIKKSIDQIEMMAAVDKKDPNLSRDDG